MLFCYMIGTDILLTQTSRKYYISVYQFHRATRNQGRYGIENRPSQTLIFTGFAECQNTAICYRQDVSKYKALWAVEGMTIGHFYVKFLTHYFISTHEK